MKKVTYENFIKKLYEKKNLTKFCPTKLIICTAIGKINYVY